MTTDTTPKNQTLIKRIGVRIAILREVRGFTAEKFAEYVKISPEELKKYEDGTKSMSVDELATIAAALDIGGFHFFL